MGIQVREIDCGGEVDRNEMRLGGVSAPFGLPKKFHVKKHFMERTTDENTIFHASFNAPSLNHNSGASPSHATPRGLDGPLASSTVPASGLARGTISTPSGAMTRRRASSVQPQVTATTGCKKKHANCISVT